jgi:C4-dicarboxylate transporter DctQ subunit
MSLVTRTREHIRVDFFVQLLPAVPRQWIQLVVDLAMLAMMVALGWFGVHFVIFSRMSITPALEVPMDLYYVSFPLGCLLSVIRLARNIVTDLQEALTSGSARRPD